MRGQTAIIVAITGMLSAGCANMDDHAGLTPNLANSPAVATQAQPASVDAAQLNAIVDHLTNMGRDVDADPRGQNLPNADDAAQWANARAQVIQAHSGFAPLPTWMANTQWARARVAEMETLAKNAAPPPSAIIARASTAASQSRP